MAKGKAFGGAAINFHGRQETMEDVFGAQEISPAEMTKKLWAFVRAHQLMTREEAPPEPSA